MRISWLSAEEIASARHALTADGATYEDHFHPDFVAPPEPPGSEHLDWIGVTEHVARAERVSKAVRDTGLADFYVGAGRLDDAEALFERRHEEDRGDVAVALSASRAFLAAGSISRAVRWLGIGAVRAAMLGRDELAGRLRRKQERVRERLS